MDGLTGRFREFVLTMRTSIPRFPPPFVFRRRSTWTLALAFVLGVVVPNSSAQPLRSESPGAESLVVRFIDVGQGDSILLKTSSGRGWLIDGGQSTRDVTQAILKSMEEEGLSKLDGILMTHPHLDHFGGLSRLVEVVEVGRVFYNIDVPAPTYQGFVKKLAARGIPYERVNPGLLDWGADVTVDVIAAKAQEEFDRELIREAQRTETPIEEYAESLLDLCGSSSTLALNLNDYSIVLHVSYGSFDLLLTGDATEEVETQALAQQRVPDGEVLKVAHHGSRYSSTRAFLDRFTPELAIIQVGAGNSYGHPHAESLDRLSQVGSDSRRNDHDGTIRLQVRSDGSYRISPRSQTPALPLE